MSVSHKQEYRTSLSASNIRTRKSFESDNSTLAGSEDSLDGMNSGARRSGDVLLHVPKRKVNFCSTVDVALVPCIPEYHAACIQGAVWFNEEEFIRIKQDVQVEFRDFLDRRGLDESMPVSSAYKLFIMEGGGSA
eukprot:CAMPEP_0174968320 /NCGR_PEP_ID=MMETSP0004_2-20121128/8069_1 /TAXON_ID=420556 /ORGANISM="Ochromonas sp., Strain CCMP1393" /LENGTH=134 /DNA_ID=CAMNT_0016217541 /DNA_START=63 /DNA_END=467 /DNA_ORIENTATION=+